MQDLASALKDIAAGLAKPSLTDVAQIAQELTVKQMRQSFQQHQTPNEEPWPELKRPSFAGVLKLSKKYLLHYKATGETKFYGRDAVAGSESFMAQRAYSIVARGKATDAGLEVRGAMQSYYEWQNSGTSSTGWGPPIPAREFWGFGNDTLDLVNNLLADRALEAFARK